MFRGFCCCLPLFVLLAGAPLVAATGLWLARRARRAGST